MTNDKKRRIQLPSVAQSIILGVGSVFSIASVEGAPVIRSGISSARDAKALGSDWRRIGGDIKSSIDKNRKLAGLK